MRRGSAFWGLALLLVGAVLLAQNFGLITGNVWPYLWPGLLILLGLFVLIGTATGRTAEAERVALPLDGAEAARVVIDHGVGPARLTGAAAPGMLLEGEFRGGLHYEQRVQGGTSTLSMKLPDDIFPMFIPFGDGPDWRFRLAPNVPLSLRVKGGAGILHLNLHDLRVTDLQMDGSVGTAEVTTPAQAGVTRMKVEGGVGTLTVRVPEGVAARIKTSQGLGTISVNQARFPQVGEHLYQSAGFDTAENRVEMTLEGGVGTIKVS